MRKLKRKGWGRIYCESVEDIEKIEAIIKEIDEFEFDYLPEDLIAPFSEYPRVTYTHKFCDLDMDELTAICWKRGIKIWVFDTQDNEYPYDDTV